MHNIRNLFISSWVLFGSMACNKQQSTGEVAGTDQIRDEKERGGNWVTGSPNTYVTYTCAGERNERREPIEKWKNGGREKACPTNTFIVLLKDYITVSEEEDGQIRKGNITEDMRRKMEAKLIGQKSDHCTSGISFKTCEMEQKSIAVLFEDATRNNMWWIQGNLKIVRKDTNNGVEVQR